MVSLQTKIITVLVCLFLLGCAGAPKQPSSSLVVSDNASEVSASKDPVTAISPQLLYLLTLAEIASQRSQYEVALENYLHAAEQADDVRIAERATKIGLYLKDNEKTEAAAALWLKQDEKNPEARAIAALSALRKGDKALASKQLGKLLENNSADLEGTLVELAKLLHKEGKINFLFVVLDDLLLRHQQHPTLYFVQALLAGQVGKLEIALVKINQALVLQPRWNKAQTFKAQTLALQGNFVPAQTVLKAVLEENPKNNRISKMLARMLVKTKDFDAAVELYQQVLSNKPEDHESQFALALVLLQQGKDKQALAELEKLANKPKWDEQASFYSGRIEYKNKNYGQAIAWFDRVKQGVYAYDAAVIAVSALLQQANFDQAEKRLQALLVRYPKQRLNIFLLTAELYIKQEKYQQAFAVLTGALQQFPNNRDLLYARSLVAEKLDKLDFLETDLKKIIVNNPKDFSALNMLGYTLVDKTERYAEAEVYLQQAIALNPNEIAIIDSMGWLQFKKGNVKEALELLRSAHNKQPISEIAAHLAEVLWVLGNKQEAKRIFANSLKKSPTNKYLLKLLKRLPQLSSQ